ncbi:MAG: hypothetical protein WCI55_12230 [Armatimonadota bacterium]
MKSIQSMLLVDWYERKVRNWPLHKYMEVVAIKIQNLTCLVAGRFAISRRLPGLDVIRERLIKSYPFAQWILTTFRGEVILAGGAICRIILESGRGNSDADFFFINCTKERIDQILREVFTYIKANGEHFVALRNLKTTTFCVTTDDSYRANKKSDYAETNFDDKYQFIHSRSYPTAASVIGGFDLTIAACFYDGENIWMTNMCAFSLTNRFNIVDPDRRSTTYESRLRKYASAGATIVFPFTNLEGIKQHYRQLNPERLLLGSSLRHEVVKGLEVWIPGDGLIGVKSNHALLVTSETKNPYSVGDYGPNAIGLKRVRFFNGVLANRGDLDGLTWYGTNMTDVFDQPDIQVDFPQYFQTEKESENMSVTNLIMWIGKEEAHKIIAKVGTGDGSEVTREAWTKFIPEIKRKVKLAIRKVETDVEGNGVTYIGPSENPGRQHTSSFNPVYGNVRDYYSPVARKLRTVGINHETWWLLKQAAGKGFPRDVLNYICRITMDLMVMHIKELLFKTIGKQPEDNVVKAGTRQKKKAVCKATPFGEDEWK